MSQRRCERAVADLKEAGLMTVKQPRKINDEGEYVGLRAIRAISEQFFDFLRLGPMLEKERARKTAQLRREAAKRDTTLTEMAGSA